MRGVVQVPGDKSISHRALMLAAIADGKSRIRGFLNGNDCLATAKVLRQMGATLTLPSPDQRERELIVEGVGLHGLCEPKNILDCENSGTTIRLLAGLLCAQPFFSVLTGSDQIRRRPMGRVVDPLREMGAQIHGRQKTTLAPLAISPSKNIRGISYQMPVASAQVKSAILLAGLYADGATTVFERGASRDHTERMLRSCGVRLSRLTGCEPVNLLSLTPVERLAPLDIEIPGDISSAAFLMVGATIVPNSDLVLTHVGVNPTRTGILVALQKMGASIDVSDYREVCSEPVANLHIRHAPLKGAEFGGAEIVTMIDELPILALAATQAEGTTIIRDAQELMVKETNRIQTTVSELQKLGAKIEATPDGFVIEGPVRLKGSQVDSHHDHRLAIMLQTAALVADGQTQVANAHVIADSFPGFEKCLFSAN